MFSSSILLYFFILGLGTESSLVLKPRPFIFALVLWMLLKGKEKGDPFCKVQTFCFSVQEETGSWFSISPSKKYVPIKIRSLSF